MCSRHRGNSAVRPDKALARGLPIRSAVGRRARKDTAVAKNRDLAHLLDRLAHQRGTAAAPLVERARTLYGTAHPFCTRTGFTRTAPAHNNSGPPIPLGGQLMRHGPKIE
jgi:hypothetical protein